MNKIMKPSLKILLDKTYELEGLIHLALKRPDDIDEFSALISKKSEDIYNISKTLKLENPELVNSDSYPLNDNISMDEYSLEENADEHSIDRNDIDHVNNNSVPEVRSRGKLVFSINEKYKFKKELFNNSDVDFNNTLALIVSMENYEEAEDFFVNDENFDLSDPVVNEFLIKIKKYFS